MGTGRTRGPVSPMHCVVMSRSTQAEPDTLNCWTGDTWTRGIRTMRHAVPWSGAGEGERGRLIRWTGALGLLVTATLAATSCSAPGTSSENASSQPATPASSPASVGLTPSAFARTICEPKLRSDLAHTLGFSTMLPSSAHASKDRYSCTYSLPTGRLIVSVTESQNTKTARRYFDSLRRSLGSTKDVQGLGALGLPAFKTPGGRTVYLKGREILDVDATDLPPSVGITAQSRGDLADYCAVRTIWPDT